MKICDTQPGCSILKERNFLVNDHPGIGQSIVPPSSGVSQLSSSLVCGDAGDEDAWWLGEDVVPYLVATAGFILEVEVPGKRP